MNKPNPHYYLTVSPLKGLIPHLDGLIAQSVEQGIENPCVPGSIPGRATIRYKAPEDNSSGAFFVSTIPTLHSYTLKYA